MEHSELEKELDAIRLRIKAWVLTPPEKICAYTREHDYRKLIAKLERQLKAMESPSPSWNRYLSYLSIQLHVRMLRDFWWAEEGI